MNISPELNYTLKYTLDIILQIQSLFFLFKLINTNFLKFFFHSNRSSYYQSTDSLGTSSAATSLSSSSNPLDSNKTIHTTTNNSSQQTLSDEPSMKMAKLQPNVQQQQKKVDKKKALKRL